MAKSSGGFANLVSPSVSARFYNGKSQAKVSKEMGAVLDGLSKAFGGETIGVTSGYRSPARNAAVKGAKSSYHMKGQAVDIDMSGWSEAKRQQAVETLTALGVGGFITYSESPNMMHIDLRPTPTGVPHFMFDKTAARMAKAPGWFQAVAARAQPVGLAAQLPDSMQAPQSREQAMAQAAQAEAFRDPTRALDVVPSAPSVGRLASQYGQYRAGTVPASMPVGLSRPAPISMPSAPPRGAVYAGITAMDGSLPSPASTMMASMAARPAQAPARPGPVTQGVRPSLSVGSLPAAPQQTTVATRPSTPAPTGLPAARAQTTVTTRPATPAPTGPPAAPGPTTAQLAEQYGQYRTPTAYTNVRNALQAVQPPAALPTAPVAPPAIQPAAVPPAAILAPALAPPRAIQDRPIAEYQAPPAAPKATAYDVYDGLADTALDNTGQNTVGRIGNTTTVTNKYGVTTGMTPYGKQTAIGSLPSVPGSLPGIKGPNMGKFGKAVKGALPSIGGGLLGSALAGPLGGMIGAALAKAVSQPGGFLSNQNNFQTDYFGNIVTNKPQGGLGFPSAPSGGYGSGGRMGASFSNNSRSGMQGISPGAADAIGRGQGGLY